MQCDGQVRDAIFATLLSKHAWPGTHFHMCPAHFPALPWPEDKRFHATCACSD